MCLDIILLFVHSTTTVHWKKEEKKKKEKQVEHYGVSVLFAYNKGFAVSYEKMFVLNRLCVLVRRSKMALDQ